MSRKKTTLMVDMGAIGEQMIEVIYQKLRDYGGKVFLISATYNNEDITMELTDKAASEIAAEIFSDDSL